MVREGKQVTDVRVLSVFDGMSCGYLAMLGAGLKVSRYVAYEIDKYAVQTSSHNFPDIEHKGDVFEDDFTEYRGFDFLVGGSPCTYWSIAQKNGRETEASGMGWELFCQYVRALREAQPMFFIYENNKSMSNAIRESITETFGFEPICINSSLVSAQNRQRLYWVGKRNPNGTYSRVHVEQPEDRGILLKDILDSGEIFYETTEGKSFALVSSYYKAAENPFGTFGNERRRQRVAEPVSFPFGETNGKAFAPTSSYWKGQPLGKILDKSQRSHVAETVRVGSLPRPNGELSTSQAFRVYSTDGKSVNITSGGGGAGGKTGLYAIPVEFEGEVPTKAMSMADGKTYTVYQVKDGQITIKGKAYPIKLADGFYIIRKLTVEECKRLQTVPEWYEFPVSDTQAYRQLGNGWTIEVVIHLIKATQSGALAEEQLSLF
jgi:DNA (cytosine-5)-methyltransferase 3A